MMVEIPEVLPCDREALAELRETVCALLTRECSERDGECVISTDCYYPSADVVRVYVSMVGDGYRVTDGGGVERVAFLHGADEPAIHAALQTAKSRYHLEVENGVLVAEVPDEDWLHAAILSVANGAALAAALATQREAYEARIAALEGALRELIDANFASARDKQFGVIDDAIAGARSALGKDA